MRTPLSARRTHGWEQAYPGWSGGDRCNPGTIGHTGFTGTGLWIDFDAGRTIEVPLSITLDQRNGQRPIIITHLQDQGTVTLFDQGVLRLVGHHKILASGVVRYRITR